MRIGLLASTLGNLGWAVIGAAIGAVFAAPSGYFFEKWQRRRTQQRLTSEGDVRNKAKRVTYDPGDRAFDFQTWNSDLRSILRPRDVAPTLTVDAPVSDWISDRSAWERELERAIDSHGLGGRTAYLVGLTLDNPEVRGDTERRRRFGWTVAEGDYATFLATRSYIEGVGKSDRPLIHERLEKHWPDAIAKAAPSILACNITIVSVEGMVLAMRRSQAVATLRGVWQLGPHETMNWLTVDEGGLGSGGPETAFSLGHRTVLEEVGLTPDEYGPILFSWFGMYMEDISSYLFGHVRSLLSASTITDRILQAQAVYEHARGGEDVVWLPYEAEMLRGIIRASHSGQPDEADRLWLGHSALSSVGLWRMGTLLKDNPDEYHRLTSDIGFAS